MALRTSWQGGSSDRLRAVVVAATAGLVTVLLCGLTSALLMTQRVEHRQHARAFVPVRPGERPALRNHALPDVAPGDGRQIWIYRWHLEDPGVRIPGVPREPPPDSWYVTPALAERMAHDAGLASRFPGAAVTGEDGIGQADELVAHRVVGAHVPLPTALSPRTGTDGMELGDPSDMRANAVVRASLVLFPIPVGGLLLAGLASAAVGLDRRLGILRALGASPAARRRLVTWQAVLCAAPGVALGAAAWSLVAPRLTTVPIVGRSAALPRPESTSPGCWPPLWVASSPCRSCWTPWGGTSPTAPECSGCSSVGG